MINTIGKQDNETVEIAVSSIEQLVHTITQQQDIFHAMKLAREINDLNGYDVISGYHYKKIKNHYTKNKSVRNDFSKNGFPKIKSDNMETEKTKSRKIENHSMKNKMKELQKGYMKMLSV